MVIIAASKCSLLVRSIAIGCYSVDTMCSSILGGHRQILTDDALPKHLLYSPLIPLLVLDQRHKGLHILSIWEVWNLWLQPVQWHERDSASSLFIQNVHDSRGSIVVVDNIVKQRIACYYFRGCLVLIDLNELSKRAVAALQIVLCFDSSDRLDAATG